MYTEELGYGSTHEVEALEIEIDSPAMRSKKYACFSRCKVLCRIVMWAVITDMFTWLWGPQSRSSWRGEWLKCLHGHGTFKFQVRFRVEGHQCGFCNLFQRRWQFNDTQNVSYTLHACCAVAQLLLLAWNGRARENGSEKKIQGRRVHILFPIQDRIVRDCFSQFVFGCADYLNT